MKCYQTLENVHLSLINNFLLLIFVVAVIILSGCMICHYSRCFKDVFLLIWHFYKTRYTKHVWTTLYSNLSQIKIRPVTQGVCPTNGYLILGNLQRLFHKSLAPACLHFIKTEKWKLKRFIKGCLRNFHILTTEFVFYWFNDCVNGKRIVFK